MIECVFRRKQQERVDVAVVLEISSFYEHEKMSVVGREQSDRSGSTTNEISMVGPPSHPNRIGDRSETLRSGRCLRLSTNARCQRKGDQTKESGFKLAKYSGEKTKDTVPGRQVWHWISARLRTSISARAAVNVARLLETAGSAPRGPC